MHPPLTGTPVWGVQLIFSFLIPPQKLHFPYNPLSITYPNLTPLMHPPLTGTPAWGVPSVWTCGTRSGILSAARRPSWGSGRCCSAEGCGRWSGSPAWPAPASLPCRTGSHHQDRLPPLSCTPGGGGPHATGSVSARAGRGWWSFILPSSR